MHLAAGTHSGHRRQSARPGDVSAFVASPHAPLLIPRPPSSRRCCLPPSLLSFPARHPPPYLRKLSKATMAFVGAPLGGVAARTPLTSSRSAVTARPAGVTMAAAPLSRRGLLGLAAAAAAAVAVPSVFAEETAVIDAPAVTEAASSAASAVSSAASAVADAPAKAVEAVKTAAPDSPAKAVEAVKAAAPDAPAPLVATNFTVTGDYVPGAFSKGAGWVVARLSRVFWCHRLSFSRGVWTSCFAVAPFSQRVADLRAPCISFLCLFCSSLVLFRFVQTPS